jgi:prevent-host-death family protein
MIDMIIEALWRSIHMEKTISALDARRRLGQVLEEVFYQGNQFIVERAGKPMAVVVPIRQYRQWKEKREQFFAAIDRVRESNKDIPLDVIEAEVEEAIHDVRKGKREAKR